MKETSAQPQICVSWDTVYARSSEVALRTIADEAFLVPVSGDLAKLMNLFVLEGSARVLWELMDGERPLRGVLEGALDALDVGEEELRRDLIEFAGELLTARLIQPKDVTA